MTPSTAARSSTLTGGLWHGGLVQARAATGCRSEGRGQRCACRLCWAWGVGGLGERVVVGIKYFVHCAKLPACEAGADQCDGDVESVGSPCVRHVRACARALPTPLPRPAVPVAFLSRCCCMRLQRPGLILRSSQALRSAPHRTARAAAPPQKLAACRPARRPILYVPAPERSARSCLTPHAELSVFSML